MKLLTTLLAATLCILAAATNAQPSAPPNPTAADEAAIREARRIQTEALAKDDVETVVKYWTPDITIRRALGHPVESAATARKIIEPTGTVNPATRMIFQRQAVSVQASANWPLAYEEGTWSGHVGNVNNKPVMAGRYSAQWVKRDGQWLIRSEVFVALTCADAGCKAAALP